jgi:probable HAF family extracellular repeat protein
MSRLSLCCIATVALIATLACRPDRPLEPNADRSAPLIAASVQAPADYEMIDLGPLGSPGVIDKQGRVYASRREADFSLHIYRWDDGVTTDLGSLPPASGLLRFSPNGLVAGMSCPGEGRVCTYFLFDEGTVTPLETDEPALDGSELRAVLDDGTVIAWVKYFGRRAPTIWQKGVRRELDSLDGASNTVPFAVNKHGQVIAQSVHNRPTPGHIRPYFWDNGVARDLGGLFDRPCADNPERICGNAETWAINDQGDVIGQSWDAESNTRAVIWRKAGAVEDLGVLPWVDASRSFINDHDDIVFGVFGLADWFAMIKGVVYSSGVPAGVSNASDLNERGEVVGRVRIDGRNHAFVWRNGQMTDLGLGPAGLGAAAVRIDDTGNILGSYTSAPFQGGLVLWRPVYGNTVATGP